MLKIETFEGGFDRNFDYLIYCEATGKAALVDAATPPESILESITSRGLNLERLLLTHTHSDHIAYLSEWTALYPDIQVLGHEAPISSMQPNYVGLKDAAEIEIGYAKLMLIETPGHYPDCVCWYAKEPDSLFTGDTIFIGRTGRTIDPLSDVFLLYRSVYDHILTLPGNTAIYPGHNYGMSPTLQLDELVRLSRFFRCGNVDQFVKVMIEYETSRRGNE